MEEGDEIGEGEDIGFFAKRAKLFPKKTPEELQAAAELMDSLKWQDSEPSRGRPRKISKEQDFFSLENREDETSDDFLAKIELSSASRRRLKKLKAKQLEELERINAENEKIFSMDRNFKYPTASTKETIEDSPKYCYLTLMYLSKVSRLKCLENDKFSDIFPKVAEIFNLKASEFLLCLETRNIRVEDTPKSLGLTHRDILECIPYKVKEETDLHTANTLKIYFQSNDLKEKIDLIMSKLEKMQEIMKIYSERRKIPLDQLAFYFDGEKISGDETPLQLDMESESCIDVTVLEPSSKVEEKGKGKKGKGKRGKGTGKKRGKKDVLP